MHPVLTSRWGRRPADPDPAGRVRSWASDHHRDPVVRRPVQDPRYCSSTSTPGPSGRRTSPRSTPRRVVREMITPTLARDADDRRTSPPTPEAATPGPRSVHVPDRTRGRRSWVPVERPRPLLRLPGRGRGPRRFRERRPRGDRRERLARVGDVRRAGRASRPSRSVPGRFALALVAPRTGEALTWPCGACLQVAVRPRRSHAADLRQFGRTGRADHRVDRRRAPPARTVRATLNVRGRWMAAAERAHPDRWGR